MGKADEGKLLTLVAVSSVVPYRISAVVYSLSALVSISENTPSHAQYATSATPNM
ncbi:hypothetical protein [Bifidobacterium minimum]|uniref:hypothetical protein n=1 Tax=Bifidobacterium minimum TaxID=1693 RepID=UPI000402428A|nr:hypothetical protein [Bifidobacterium minimum]